MSEYLADGRHGFSSGIRKKLVRVQRLGERAGGLRLWLEVEFDPTLLQARFLSPDCSRSYVHFFLPGQMCV